MLKNSNAFSGFSVDDLTKARTFYGETLGLDVREIAQGLELHFANGGRHFIYHKPDHEPATFTVLNFPIEDVQAAVDELASRGVQFEHYDLGGGAITDSKGILRGGTQTQRPDIAWFKDPAGNVLSILKET